MSIQPSQNANRSRHRFSGEFQARLKTGTELAPNRHLNLVAALKLAPIRRLSGAENCTFSACIRRVLGVILVPKSHRMTGDFLVPFLRLKIGAENRNVFTRTNMQWNYLKDFLISNWLFSYIKPLKHIYKNTKHPLLDNIL